MRGALEAAELAERGIYVERASSTEERIAGLADVEGPVPYMSLVLVPSGPRREPQARRVRPAGQRRGRRVSGPPARSG